MEVSGRGGCWKGRKRKVGEGGEELGISEEEAGRQGHVSDLAALLFPRPHDPDSPAPKILMRTRPDILLPDLQLLPLRLPPLALLQLLSVRSSLRQSRVVQQPERLRLSIRVSGGEIFRVVGDLEGEGEELEEAEARGVAGATEGVKDGDGGGRGDGGDRGGG